MSSQEPDWRTFEEAVARFIAAIGGNAKVVHDAKIPDVHTRTPRQRDVWIEWSIFNHFPAKALVSCKHYATPLDQQDIDRFNGEFISSGAQVGIIYAKTGFNARALDKARVLGIHCCRLYENEPSEIPNGFAIDVAYYFRPTFEFAVSGDASEYGCQNVDRGAGATL